MDHDTFFQAEAMHPKRATKLHSLFKSGQRANYAVHVWSKWNDRASDFARLVEHQGATLFQSELWLSTWYETFTTDSDVQAVIVAIEDECSGEIIMLLPLCKREEEGLTIICNADFGLADYNAPLIHADYAPDEKESQKLIHDICRALPKADFLKLEKIPHLINQTKNPLHSLRGGQDSHFHHYGVEILGNWEDYWSSLKRNFRKDQRRRWRVLEKKGAISFVWSRGDKDTIALYETLMTQQHERLQGLDLPYLLEDPRMKRFYRKIIQKGSKEGPVIFTALLVDGQPIATLCGFGNGSHYAMTLSGNETGEWSKCSPGRLLTERTMQVLHKEGYSYFDFTIGDEPYKKYFATDKGPLKELYRPLTWKALPRYSWMKAKASQRKSKLACALKRMISGKR